MNDPLVQLLTAIGVIFVLVLTAFFAIMWIINVRRCRSLIHALEDESLESVGALLAKLTRIPGAAWHIVRALETADQPLHRQRLARAISEMGLEHRYLRRILALIQGDDSTTNRRLLRAVSKLTMVVLQEHAPELIEMAIRNFGAGEPKDVHVETNLKTIAEIVRSIGARRCVDLGYANLCEPGAVSTAFVWMIPAYRALPVDEQLELLGQQIRSPTATVAALEVSTFAAGHLGARAAGLVPDLLALVGHAEVNGRIAVYRALGAIGAPAVETIRGSLETWNRPGDVLNLLTAVLALRGDLRPLVPALEGLLDSVSRFGEPAPDVVLTAAQILATIGVRSERLLRLLVEMVRTESECDRLVTAAVALKRFGPAARELAEPALLARMVTLDGTDLARAIPHLENTLTALRRQ